MLLLRATCTRAGVRLPSGYPVRPVGAPVAGTPKRSATGWSAHVTALPPLTPAYGPTALPLPAPAAPLAIGGVSISKRAPPRVNGSVDGASSGVWLAGIGQPVGRERLGNRLQGTECDETSGVVGWVSALFSTLWAAGSFGVNSDTTVPRTGDGNTTNSDCRPSMPSVVRPHPAGWLAWAVPGRKIALLLLADHLPGPRPP
jgi:hypothetical protein